jgi:hypothetical protein
MFFAVGSGYIRCQATQDLPDPANVPFYLALGQGRSDGIS